MTLPEVIFGLVDSLQFLFLTKSFVGFLVNGHTVTVRD